jgi:hypothetical protein
MMNLNCTQRSILIAVVVAVAVYLVMGRGPVQPTRERYVLMPTSLATNDGAAGVNSIFDLPYTPECTPGLPGGSYYSKDLTPGGVCGAQKFVNDVMHRYTIEDGIGGSLLDK